MALAELWEGAKITLGFKIQKPGILAGKHCEGQLLTGFGSNNFCFPGFPAKLNQGFFMDRCFAVPDQDR